MVGTLWCGGIASPEHGRRPGALAQIKEAGNAPLDGVLVCGDSGNDVELFAVPGVRGCMVVNAHAELRDWCAAHASPSIFQVCEGLFFLLMPLTPLIVSTLQPSYMISAWVHYQGCMPRSATCPACTLASFHSFAVHFKGPNEWLKHVELAFASRREKHICWAA